MLAFTDNSETILKVYSAEALRKVIKLVIVRASQVKSKSSSGVQSESGAQNQEAIKQINEGIQDEDEVEGWQ